MLCVVVVNSEERMELMHHGLILNKSDPSLAA